MVDIMTEMGQMTDISAFDDHQWDSHWDSHWLHEYSLVPIKQTYHTLNIQLKIDPSWFNSAVLKGH